MTPETAQLIHPIEGVPCAFDRSWLATPNNVSRSRRALLDALRKEGIGEPALESIGAAVTEVTTNTAFHGYIGRRIGSFRIIATISADEVEITVDDDGSGFENEAPHRAGRGLTFVASVCGRVETTSPRGSGTRTTMWFPR